ncbi:Lcl C-terminal domain-containing protein [Pseudomonas sichuanensis]
MNARAQLTPPAIGQVWPGQGGIYAGIAPARNDQEAYHLVIGAELGRFEWGPYEVDAPAKSLIDGLSNTKALVEAGEYPAANAAAAHQADGHSDFYLPAAAELYEAWLNLGSNDFGWCWSSSQRSANGAFVLLFGVGLQSSNGKHDELRVRPVRRLPIQ